MTFKNKFFVFSILLQMGSSFLFADVVSINPRPRSLSMGGAGLAILGDKDSAIMNPAGLADIEGAKTQAFPILFEFPFDVDLATKAWDFNGTRDDDKKTTAEKRAALQDLLEDASTAATAIRFNFYPSYTMKYFHLGLLFDAFVDPRLRVGGLSSNQAIEFGSTNVTAGLYAGGGYAFLDDQLQVGATLKPLYRASVIKQEDVTALDISEGMDPGSNVADQILGNSDTRFKERGYGIGIDLGAKYFLPWLKEMKPSVGITIQDIGNTRFVSDHHFPKDVTQSISLGAAIHPILWIFKTTFALDYRNIMAESDLRNKIHIGAEAVIWDLLALRVGLNQLYATGGIGVITRFFETDIFVTSREAGRFAHIQDVTTMGIRLSGSF